MTTERAALVSHQEIEDASVEHYDMRAYANGAYWIRDLYEADRSRLLREREEALGLLYEAAGYADEVTDSEGAEDFAARARSFLSRIKAKEPIK